MIKQGISILFMLTCLFQAFIVDAVALPITSGCIGNIEFQGNSISHSEFLLKANIQGVYNDNDFYIYALDLDSFNGDPWDDNYMTFTSTAASTDFNNYQVLINSGDVSGSAIFKYNSFSEQGGYYEDVEFLNVCLTGSIMDMLTGEKWSFDVKASDPLEAVPEPGMVYLLVIASIVLIFARFSLIPRKTA